MFNRISFSRTNTLIQQIFKQQSVYYLKTSSRNLNPAALKSSTLFNNNNYLEIQYLNKINNFKNVNNLEINQNIVSLLQYRNFCSNQKSSFESKDFKRSEKDKKETKLQQGELKLDIEDEIPPKISIFAKFKLMYKKYWYVLIPVHFVTSVGWFFGFYLVSQSGVDIPTFLEHINISETVIDKLRNSNMGHYAIAYLCYKLVTPVRYAVTLGGTTVTIRYLVRLGYIKPVPTKQQVMDKFKKAKDDYKQRRDTMVKKVTERNSENKS